MQWRSNWKWAVSGAFVSAAVAGAAYLHQVLDRPGETALAMIPSNAFIAGYVDLVPGPSQVGAFAKLQSIAAKTLHGKPLPVLMSGILPAEIAPDVAPLLKLSGAFGAFGKDFQTSKGLVAFLAVRDTARVNAILSAKLKQSPKGGVFASRDAMVCTVIDGYLTVAGNQATLDAVGRVRAGAARSILTNPGFRALWAKRLPDANAEVGYLANGAWANASLRIGVHGLDFRALGSPGILKQLYGLPVPALRPLLPDSLARMPGGAYAAIGVSQISSISKFTPHTADNIVLSFLDKGLAGDSVIGVYPFSVNPRIGIVMTTFFSAKNDPSVFREFAALRKRTEFQVTGGEPMFANPVKVGDATVYRLVTPLRKVAAKLVAKSGLPPILSPFLKDLSLSYMTCPDGVYLCSSNAGMDALVKFRKTHSASMAMDPAFAQAKAECAMGSSAVLSVSPERLVEGLIQSLAKHDTDQVRQYGPYAMSAGAGLVLSVNFAATGPNRLDISLPMNYDKFLKDPVVWQE